MPQYQQQKKGQARIRILSEDTTRVYLMLMQKTNCKMQALPGGVFVLDETMLTFLEGQNIPFEVIERK